ncbi:hypothetical protein [Parabacteroides faecis]|uniref:hypothetical protein n=1 Tax=Parabacteroides faecis TaxID=1217282 RepID=UPI0021644A97|nr:hypothetical protein [Parabacteroides faecis]MCS2890489.1 hypothetical protein [Parabacteroides faecis]UVQ45831.1 hypothetical protein NXY11_22155 [Parabacteroides faecis]
MKKGIFIIYSLFVFCCCSEKETIQDPINPDVTSFSGLVGEKFYVFIEMRANGYSLKNNDPQIISWEYIEKDDAICIYALNDGIGSIDVQDTEGNIKSIISVSAYDFGSSNIEEIAMHPTEKSSVFVEANDKNISKLIEDELWTEIKQKKKTLYSFNKETKEFTMNIPLLEQTFCGTFNWSIDSLTLKYNDITEKYSFQVATGRLCYIIRADKTKEYQLLYPDAGITSVKVKRIWYDWDIADLPR